MATYLDLIDQVDSFPILGHDESLDIYRFQVVGVSVTLGFLLRPLADVLSELPTDWEVSHRARTVILIGGTNHAERSARVAETLHYLRGRDEHFAAVLSKWRHETFPVYGPGRQVLLSFDRCASGLFGIVTYAVHALAYTMAEGDEDPMRIWVPRRSRLRPTYAGMLDSTAAGGIATGELPFETLLRECEEEAALPPGLVRQRARAVSLVSNFTVHGTGTDSLKLLQPEFHYVYDLPLPAHVMCTQNDSEVAEFHLWSVTQVKQALANREFKPNSALVMLDFFIRHGILTPDNEPEYIDIISRLHRRLDFPTR
ncbi:thiamine pyrophosphokinase-related protein [Aspergillus sclerotiicarbonarius CBS 121057]|uniref:Thiamine pyrophosphokinase-related protein n=1 Tax=Aspergillus sclerotiicarbonarius (strain CBS 121057 / IBT 28362) TaxID=1448318 RepID=A0A319EUN7_ASPSB|nr:thiamine pyrophosphokinase-related protein [Aspergillus sclerotiicarbonarius CBS 121057]